MPTAPGLPAVPKSNWTKFHARKAKFFGTKPWSFVFFIWNWAQFIFSGITIYYVTAIDSLPFASPTFPRFRHGNAQTQQAQMQLDTFSEKHDLQVFLILMVVLMVPQALMGIVAFHKNIFNGAEKAEASAADKQTSDAITAVLIAAFCFYLFFCFHNVYAYDACILTLLPFLLWQQMW